MNAESFKMLWIVLAYGVYWFFMIFALLASSVRMLDTKEVEPNMNYLAAAIFVATLIIMGLSLPLIK